VHGLLQTYHRLKIHFGYHRLRKLFLTHPIVLFGDEAQVEACFVPFADSTNLDAI
jgi:hypothetical protein